MPFRRSWLLTVGLCVLMVCLPLGCGSKIVGRSVLGAKVGDREVKASMDGGGFISGHADAITVTTSIGKFVVEKDRVQLDGQEISKVSADAKLVELDITAGKLTLKADGAEILSKVVGK